MLEGFHKISRLVLAGRRRVNVEGELRSLRLGEGHWRRLLEVAQVIVVIRTRDLQLSPESCLWLRSKRKPLNSWLLLLFQFINRILLNLSGLLVFLADLFVALEAGRLREPIAVTDFAHRQIVRGWLLLGRGGRMMRETAVARVNWIELLGQLLFEAG